jgi:ABC-type polar amino acid transport system ATPase subunit
MVTLAKDGMTMICVTHEMGFAKTVAHQQQEMRLTETPLLIAPATTPETAAKARPDYPAAAVAVVPPDIPAPRLL